MTDNRIYIGIDPDVERSGIAVYSNGSLTLVDAVSLQSLITYFRELHDTGLRACVFVEASWLMGAHNYHAQPADSKAVAAKKGYHVGRNHQVGIDIRDIARLFGFIVTEVKPLRKFGTGKDRKTTHEEMVYLCRMYGCEFPKKRSNQEERDATRIVLLCKPSLPL